ncbi:MAG TPA: enoyl-CoA hydratase/isomerase family protein [Xanthobacteraceae bacterium]|jgi:enoyl-CoA hydratase
MIELTQQDGMAILRMADGKANAMSLEFCELLTARLEELHASAARAIIITGQGRIFSAGVDLVRLLDGGVPYIRRFLPALCKMLAAVFACQKPLVAAVNGHAIAGGCVLACAADRRLMGQEAGRIGVTELPVGVPLPQIALEIMRCATAPEHFADVLLSAATYAPADALRRGLIHEIVDPGILLQRALDRADALAALPPAAFAVTKRQIRQAPLERAKLDETRAEVERIWTAPETVNRIRDYVARTLRK